jgi:hypothetical protein
LVIQGGQGAVIQWNISHRVRLAPATYRETVANCGILLPDLTGSVLTNNQRFGLRFPNAMFDKGQIPPGTVTATTSMVGADERYEAGPVVMLTGLTLSDPTNTSWPTSFLASQMPDQDHDGMPGVTAVAVDSTTDPNYNLLPVGLPPAPPAPGADYPRASRVALVARTVADMNAAASGCDELDGDVDVTLINGTAALNFMVVGCTKATGDQCTHDEATFLNGELPVFAPSGPGTLLSVRMPDGVGCQDVRMRFPQ